MPALDVAGHGQCRTRISEDVSVERVRSEAYTGVLEGGVSEDEPAC